MLFKVKSLKTKDTKIKSNLINFNDNGQFVAFHTHVAFELDRALCLSWTFTNPTVRDKMKETKRFRIEKG